MELLQQGFPDPDALDENGDAPLHAYVRRRDENTFTCLMTFLVHSKCDVDQPNREGLTALHLASEVSLREMWRGALPVFLDVLLVAMKIDSCFLYCPTLCMWRQDKVFGFVCLS